MCNHGPKGEEGGRRTGNLRINKQHTVKDGWFGQKIVRTDCFIEEEYSCGEHKFWLPLRIEETYSKIYVV